MFIENIIKKIGQICSWLTLALVILISFDVFLRYLFNFSTASLYELEWHLFAIIFLLGSAYTLQKNEHVRVDVFYNKLSEKYILGRVRLLLIEPRTSLSWHRDPEPRLHIPIMTNPGAHLCIGDTLKHLPADGSVWFTDTRNYHTVFNGGEENRIHLVATYLGEK